jgi:hypothetical protein
LPIKRKHALAAVFPNVIEFDDAYLLAGPLPLIRLDYQIDLPLLVSYDLHP